MNPLDEPPGAELRASKQSRGKRVKWSDAVAFGGVLVLIAWAGFDWYLSRDQQSTKAPAVEAKTKNVYRSGDLTFYASPCSHENDIAMADKLSTDGHSQPRTEWRSDGNLVVSFDFWENCGVSFPSARFVRHSDMLQLEYVERAPAIVPACLCVFQLVFEISGLEKMDYRVAVTRVIQSATSDEVTSRGDR